MRKIDRRLGINDEDAIAFRNRADVIFNRPPSLFPFPPHFRFRQPLYVLGEDVGFEVHLAAEPAARPSVVTASV